jgi:mono/diheme cytochrome c family protein
MTPWATSSVRCLLLAAVLAVVPGAPLHAQASEPSRGRLLYETHCVACHNSQMHWRDRRIARDWPGLVEQVRAWQARASLGWSEGDIVEVARHLNDTIYRFPRPLARSAQRPRPNA